MIDMENFGVVVSCLEYTIDSNTLDIITKKYYAVNEHTNFSHGQIEINITKNAGITFVDCTTIDKDTNKPPIMVSFDSVDANYLHEIIKKFNIIHNSNIKNDESLNLETKKYCYENATRKTEDEYIIELCIPNSAGAFSMELDIPKESEAYCGYDSIIIKAEDGSVEKYNIFDNRIAYFNNNAPSIIEIRNNKIGGNVVINDIEKNSVEYSKECENLILLPKTVYIDRNEIVNTVEMYYIQYDDMGIPCKDNKNTCLYEKYEYKSEDSGEMRTDIISLHPLYFDFFSSIADINEESKLYALDQMEIMPDLGFIVYTRTIYTIPNNAVENFESMIAMYTTEEHEEGVLEFKYYDDIVGDSIIIENEEDIVETNFSDRALSLLLKS